MSTGIAVIMEQHWMTPPPNMDTGIAVIIMKLTKNEC